MEIQVPEMYAARSMDDASEDEHQQKRRRMSPAEPTVYSRRNGGRHNGGGGTKLSFAERQMAKMGYKEGEGLGLKGQGRLAPIETQLRPQGAGLGAVKEKTKQSKDEEKREAAFRGQVLEDSSEEDRRKRKAKKKLQNTDGRKGQTFVTPAKPKIKTIAETEAEGLKVPNVLKSIIDATGSETRLLNSTAGILSQNNYVSSETEETKLTNKAQRELQSFTDEWMSLKEREDFFATEGVELSEELAKEEHATRADTDILRIIHDVQSITLDSENSEGSAVVWDNVIAKLKPLEEASLSTEEASICSEVAVATLHPIFKATMYEWKPLEDPVGIAPYIDALRLVLGISPSSANTTIATRDDTNNGNIKRRHTSVYETMIYTDWLPPVRSAINQDWDVTDPTSLLSLLEAWTSVLPPFILGNVIDQLVVKRLADAVAAWNPVRPRKTKTQISPPHVWLFPWLEYLDDQHTDPRSPTGLMSDVKRKFKQILSSWNLTKGLIPGLENWKSVLRSDLSAMLIRYLLPRFRPHLANFEVDPRQQEETFGILEDVLQWASFFPATTMAELIKSDFFPKWHQSLYIWLTSPGVNYNEVSEWYTWWKGVFEESISTEFSKIPSIASEWERGLQFMFQASEMGPEAASELPPPTIESIKTQAEVESSARRKNRSSPQTETTPLAAAALDTPTSFKDVVEDWCTENDLHLKPLREADLQSGLPLFRITASFDGKGGAIVYLKGDVVWVRNPGSVGAQSRVFSPMGLDDALIKRAGG